MYYVNKESGLIFARISPVKMVVGRKSIDGVLHGRKGDLFVSSKVSFEASFTIIDCEPPKFTGLDTDEILARGKEILKTKKKGGGKHRASLTEVV